MKLKKYLGKEVKIIIDRPIGSKHPEHNFVYELNYGYLPGTKAPDGEEIDAYIIGTNKPIGEATGKCIAIIHRTNDDDDKLVIAINGKQDISDEKLKRLVAFQEQYFEHIIIKED